MEKNKHSNLYKNNKKTIKRKTTTMVATTQQNMARRVTKRVKKQSIEALDDMWWAISVVGYKMDGMKGR